MIDTHCHLNIAPLEENITDVIHDAQQAGVTRIIVPGVSVQTSQSAALLQAKHTGVFAAAGIHPHEAGEWGGDVQGIERLLDQFSSIVAVGEIGLDYLRSDGSETKQLDLFRMQLELARKYAKPVIIHTRDAFEETINILAEYSQLSILIHSFSGTTEQAAKLLDAGYLLSLNGIMTFRKNEQLRQTVGSLPLDRLVLETDAPYLSPEGFRGKSNEPCRLLQIARCLAEVKKLTVEVIDEMTTATAVQFFNLPE